MAATVQRNALNRAEQTHDQKLRRQGYTPAAKRRVPFRGKPLDEVKYTKNEVGKTVDGALEAAGRGFVGVVGTVFSFGLLNISDKFRKFAWTDATEAGKGTGPSVARCAAGVFGTIATAGILPIADALTDGKLGFLDATFKPAVLGKAEKTLYFQTDEQEDISHLDYDPKSSDSIQEYMRECIRKGDADIRTMSDGSIVKLENRRGGKSSFLLIPKGDWSKARSMKYWNGRTGDALKDPAAQWRAINTYLAGRSEIEQDLDKKADKAAMALAKKEGNEDDELYIKKLRDGMTRAEADTKANLEGRQNDEAYIRQLMLGIRKRYDTKTIKVSAKNHSWRLASDDLNNPNQNRSVWGSFNKETSKHIDMIHNKNMMEHKGKLGGEKSFKKRPEIPSQEGDLPTDDEI